MEVSQLQNDCTRLPNGTHVPKSGFAVAKYPAKWSFPSKNGIFHALVVRSRFAAAKCESLRCKMALVCQKWFRSCEIPCRMELWLRNWEFLRFGASQPFHSCEMGAPVLRSGTHVPKVVLQQSVDFAEAAKSRKPLFLPCFCSVFAPILLRFCSERLSSISLQFLLILIIQKPILHQNKLELKHLKSKLTH